MAVYLIDFENVHEAGLTGAADLTENDLICIFYSAASQSLTLDTMAEIMSRGTKLTCYRCGRTGKNYLDFQLATVLGMMAAKGQYQDFVIVSKDKGYESLIDFWNGKKEEHGIITCRVQEKIAQIVSEEKIRQKRKPGRPAGTGKQQQKPVKESTEKQVEKQTENQTEIQKKIQEEDSVHKQNDEKAAVQVRPRTEVKKVMGKHSKEKLPEPIKKKIRNAVKEIELKPTDYTTIYKDFLRYSETDKMMNVLKSTFGKEKGAKITEVVLPIFEEFKKQRNE